MQNASDVQAKIVSGEIKLDEHLKATLQIAREKNARLNCFTGLTSEMAAATAARLAAKLTRGETPGALFGVPLAIKDNICLTGAPTTCGSRILTDFVSPYNATAVERLLAADAIPVAKANLDEFAMGSSNENSAFGPVRNPHDRERTPGGSSGGSAAAVAVGAVPLALGSDTGGSIRQPAAFCGVVGLKPTYGSVSRYGLVAYASSMDQIGPIGSDVDSTALLFDIIRGRDPRDATSVEYRGPTALVGTGCDIVGLRIGLPEEYFDEGLNGEIRTRLKQLTEQLRAQGATVTRLSLPHSRYAIAAYYIIAAAEASSNLARYDGVRYGRRGEATDLTEMYRLSREQGFGAEVQRRVMLGTYVLAAGFCERYYQKAMRVRSVLKEDFRQAFEQVDVLLTPTTPTTAFRLGEKSGDPLQMYLSDIYTVAVNLVGVPALSVPCGRDSQGLPIGAQLIGRHFEEAALFRLGRRIEELN